MLVLYLTALGALAVVGAATAAYALHHRKTMAPHWPS